MITQNINSINKLIFDTNEEDTKFVSYNQLKNILGSVFNNLSSKIFELSSQIETNKSESENRDLELFNKYISPMSDSIQTLSSYHSSQS